MAPGTCGEDQEIVKKIERLPKKTALRAIGGVEYPMWVGTGDNTALARRILGGEVVASTI